MPLDAVVTFRAGGDLPADLPALRNAVWLAEGGPNGERVAVDIELSPEVGVVSLVPVDPLDPDTGYYAFGIREDELGAHYQVDLPNDVIASRFYTGSRPELAWAGLVGDEMAVLVFSEAMDVASVEAGVSLVDADGAQAGTWQGTRGDRSNQFAFEVAEGAEPARFVLSDLRADAGATYGGPGSVDLDWVETETFLDRYDSLPYCEEDY